MIRRALLLVMVAFLLALPAWPPPAAATATAWACNGGDSEHAELCIMQSSNHSYPTVSVTVTAEFQFNGDAVAAEDLAIFVNGEVRAKLEPHQTRVELTYRPDPGVDLPATDSIYATGVRWERNYKTTPPTEHRWDAPPVLAASPAGTSGEVGSTFVVQARLTQESKPLSNTEVRLASSMPGQPSISRTAITGATGSVNFSYTRPEPGLDEIVVSASGQGWSDSVNLTRRWRLGPTTSTPTPPSASPSTPTDGFTRTPPASTPTDSSGPPLTSSPTSTPTETPTPLRASLELSPNGTSTTVGRDFTVTATLSTSSGDPVPDRQVTFETTKSGEVAITRTATTDNDGNARFTYRRSTTGSDAVLARVTVDGTGLSERILHQWVAGPTPPAGTLRLDSDVVNPGSDLRLTGNGCPANGPIELSIGDVRLADARADGSGAYRVVAPLPELPLGRHKVKASCASFSTTATVDVVGVTAAMGTAGAAGATTVAVLAFFVLLGGSIVRGLGNLGIDLPFT